jgi:hypothetical protein
MTACGTRVQIPSQKSPPDVSGGLFLHGTSFISGTSARSRLVLTVGYKSIIKAGCKHGQ